MFSEICRTNDKKKKITNTHQPTEFVSDLFDYISTAVSLGNVLNFNLLFNYAISFDPEFQLNFQCTVVRFLTGKYRNGKYVCQRMASSVSFRKVHKCVSIWLWIYYLKRHVENVYNIMNNIGQKRISAVDSISIGCDIT